QVFLGSPKLAFVLGTTTFSSAHQLGTVAVLSVWVRREDRWTLLAISNDPISVQGARTDLPRLAAALVPGNDAQLAPAELLAPADGVFPQAAPGQRFGDFIWRPSPSADVIGEVAEFAYSNGD